VAALMATARGFARAAAALAPDAREAYWAQGRTLLGAITGPGSRERLLARTAFEWAAASAAPATDALFALRPAAWVIVQAGGPDALALALLARAGESIPCLLIDTDVASDDPFARACRSPSAPISKTKPSAARRTCWRKSTRAWRRSR
jgi:ATP-dependent helicase/nuclease subunit B